MSFMVKFDGLFHPSPHDGPKEEDRHQDEKDDSHQKKPTSFSLDHGRDHFHPQFTFFRRYPRLPPLISGFFVGISQRNTINFSKLITRLAHKAIAAEL
jgi:hypothetical protein